MIINDDILRKIGLSFEDFYFADFENIKNTDLKFLTMGKFDVFELKNIYIIKLNKSILTEEVLDVQEKKQLIHTNKGSYLVYKSN